MTDSQTMIVSACKSTSKTCSRSSIPPPPQVLTGELKDPFRLEVAVKHFHDSYPVRPEAAQKQIVDQLWELISRWSNAPRPSQTLSGESKDPFALEHAIEDLRAAYRVRPDRAQKQIVDQLWELIGHWSNTPRPPHS